MGFPNQMLVCWSPRRHIKIKYPESLSTRISALAFWIVSVYYQNARTCRDFLASWQSINSRNLLEFLTCLDAQSFQVRNILWWEKDQGVHVTLLSIWHVSGSWGSTRETDFNGFLVRVLLCHVAPCWACVILQKTTRTFWENNWSHQRKPHQRAFELVRVPDVQVFTFHMFPFSFFRCSRFLACKFPQCWVRRSTFHMFQFFNSTPFKSQRLCKQRCWQTKGICVWESETQEHHKHLAFGVFKRG